MHKQGCGRMHAIVKKVYVRRLCRQIICPTDRVRVPDDQSAVETKEHAINPIEYIPSHDQTTVSQKTSNPSA